MLLCCWLCRMLWKWSRKCLLVYFITETSRHQWTHLFHFSWHLQVYLIMFLPLNMCWWKVAITLIVSAVTLCFESPQVSVLSKILCICSCKQRMFIQQCRPTSEAICEFNKATTKNKRMFGWKSGSQDSQKSVLMRISSLTLEKPACFPQSLFAYCM